MPSDSMTAACFCCDQTLHFAPDSDPLHVIERYGVVVCASCFDQSQAGWMIEHEEKLLVHLRHSFRDAPGRNALSRFPRD